MAGWRQTSRQRQADRQADTGRQAVEHRQASSQTSKQTYSQTLTDAHGHVDKHKHNHATMSWNTHKLKAAAWQPPRCELSCDPSHVVPESSSRCSSGTGTRTTAQLSLENTDVHVFNITWCKAGAGRQAGRLAGRLAHRLAGRDRYTGRQTQAGKQSD